MRLTGEPDATIITFDYPDSIRFLATSFYLGLTAVLFASICAQDTMRRMATLRSAYSTADVITSVLGTIGYFQLWDLGTVFTDGSRATGGFKGPNDLGAYLIAPLMWLFEGFMVDRIRLRSLLATAMILVALLLTFSRGAWGSSVVSTAVLTYLIFITQNDPRLRRRIVFFIVLGIAAIVVLLLLLSSIDTVSQMISERTHLQDYDVNADNRSRFRL
jgi:O-antigen ligase